MNTVTRCLLVLAPLALMASPGFTQQPPAAASCQSRGAISGPSSARSVEVAPDGRITFRLCAPAAADVRATSPDMGDAIPSGGNAPAGLALTKDATGLWSGTTAKSLAPDTYRYGFLVDSVAVTDPQARTFSRERAGTMSTMEVPGASAAFQAYDPKIAHGAVTTLEYWSASLGVKRSAQVYTPPGYLKSSTRFPVLYLVHGAGGSDDSWIGTGHAHYILDNLIAAGKARPMIVVMPDGHTPDRAGGNLLANNDFGNDLLKDLIPLVDSTLRTNAKASQRAMAGLSMGGSHTIRQGLTHPELFNYIGIFSMGLGNNNNQAEVAAYEKDNAAALARAAKDLKVVYYAMGKDDFLYGTSAPTRAMLDRNGIKHTYNESTGGHTWVNWRHYLDDFVPRLFQGR